MELRIECNDDEDLYRKVRGVLNKITTKNAFRLLNEMKTFPIDTFERLQGVIDLIFEKAIHEPQFSEVYVFLCRKLGNINVPEIQKPPISEIDTSTTAIHIKDSLKMFMHPPLHYKENQWSPQNPDGKKSYDRDFLFAMRYYPSCKRKPDNIHDAIIVNKEYTSFRHLLFIRCDIEFEKHWYSDECDRFNEHSMEIELITDPEMKNEFIDENHRVRSRCLGFITFIGELYKQQIVTANNFILRSLYDLIANKDEISLECWCKLLTMVGKDLSKDDVTRVFDQMLNMSNVEIENAKVSSRVRFMLQDVFDLRERGWKSRQTDQMQMQSNADNVNVIPCHIHGGIKKLRPQTFHVLLKDIQMLVTDTKEKLQTIVDIIFDIAVGKPNISVLHALLCKELALMKVPLIAESKEMVTFHALLYTRCQFEFQLISCKERNQDCTDAENNELLVTKNVGETGMKPVNKIRFIAELFNQKLIPEDFIVQCLYDLLNTEEDEENLEYLCTMMTTINKELTKDEKGALIIEQKILNIIKDTDNQVSDRVRFMLQDVIDLRRHGWVLIRTEVQN